MSSFTIENGTRELFYSSLKSLKKDIRAKEKQLLAPIGKRIVEGYKYISRRYAKYPYLPYPSVSQHNDLTILKDSLKEYESLKRKHSIYDFYTTSLSLYTACKEQEETLRSKIASKYLVIQVLLNGLNVLENRTLQDE